MTLKDLQARAAELGINGYSKLKKDDLEAAIEGAEAGLKASAPRPAVARLPEFPEGLAGGASKLAWIQQRLVEQVVKSGHHDKFNYDFFQEHGVLRVIKPWLEVANAGYIIDFTDVEINGNLTSATLMLTVFDAELPKDSPEWGVTARFPVAAADNQDKGPYKLMTQGTKYALQKMFGLPTEAIADADTDEDTPVSTAKPVGTDQAGRIAAKKAAGLRATAKQAVDDGHIDNKAVTAYLTAEFGKNRVTDLTVGEGEQFEAWLNAKIG